MGQVVGRRTRGEIVGSACKHNEPASIERAFFRGRFARRRSRKTTPRALRIRSSCYVSRRLADWEMKPRAEHLGKVQRSTARSQWQLRRASDAFSPGGRSRGAMLARGLAAVVPSAVVGRRDAGKSASSRWCSSASARRVRFTFNARRARCARVVPRHKVVTEAAVSPLARLGVCGSNRCARAITSAFDGGTTASRARRSPKFERSPWRETADARTEDTRRATRAASRGAATTARATSTGLIAPVHDGSGKPNWIQAVLTAGPFAPGYVGRTNNDTRGIHFPFISRPRCKPRVPSEARADRCG